MPKGLRSFDEHDSDFFLELLPGPRDREGLPDSLRFWRTRIEERDPDNTFSVGLIYGPSGCGKSSLVKAGLLPRLSEDVISIYTECTGEETEARLLKALRRKIPALGANLNLKEALAALRHGHGIPAGKKVFVFLDQFEQWLHAKKEEQNTELVQSLRQCDGGKVQSIVSVRDDFWLAATRFMGELEVKLLQGQNTALVDLFDLDHAQRVLAAFGWAFDKLPEHMSTEQKEFLKQSIRELAEGGKVVCVRLAIFAEMMKSKSWTPASLAEVGGTHGVGTTFLEETFTAKTAHPQHRLHQKAARRVLNALLLDSDVSLKGQMKSYDELLEASGYVGRRKDFADLMRILDSEVRLVTPTNPEGLCDSDELIPHAEAGQKYYQLAHDYLVHSLRDWLNHKQKQSVRGRAEIRLAERSNFWSRRPENRHLPSWWEYLNIRLLTGKKSWSERQAKMMSVALRLHAVRWGGTLLVLLVLAVTFRQIVADARLRNLARQVQTTVVSINTSGGIISPPLERLDELPRQMILTALREHFAETSDDKRLALAYALAYFGDVRLDFLVSQIEGAPPDEVGNLVTALRQEGEESILALETRARTTDSKGAWRHKARLAMLALHLRAPRLARQMCQLGPDPIQRTIFVDECSAWHGDVSTLVDAIATSEDGAFRSAMALVLGSRPVGDKSVQEVLSGWYREAPDSATHSAAGWAMRQWNLRLPTIPSTQLPAEGRDWYVNSVGITMLKIPRGRFVRKRVVKDPFEQDKAVYMFQQVTLTQPFFLADREVSKGVYEQFINDPGSRNEEKPNDWQGNSIRSGGFVRNVDTNEPALQLNWYDAVLFCNWLSRQEGLTACYRRTLETERFDDVEYDAWQLVSEANGYRLPTEAEWEYACRADSDTRYGFGSHNSLLKRYAVYAVSTPVECGSTLPNGWGLFDVHGNVREWCQDWFALSFADDEVVRDPIGLTEAEFRVVRGGHFRSLPSGVESASRLGVQPNLRSEVNGLRVARNVPASIPDRIQNP